MYSVRCSNLVRTFEPPDEKRRSGHHTNTSSDVDLRPDSGPHDVGFQAPLKVRGHKWKLAGMIDQQRIFKWVLAPEEQVVHFPESPLPTCALGSLAGTHGRRMNPLQWEAEEGVSNKARLNEVPPDLRGHLSGIPARVRALEIRELDEYHSWRSMGPDGRFTQVDGQPADLLDRRRKLGAALPVPALTQLEAADRDNDETCNHEQGIRNRRGCYLHGSSRHLGSVEMRLARRGYLDPRSRLALPRV